MTVLQGRGHQARQLRGAMSLPEVKLWQVLRERPGGLKFRRQHPSGPYVADFYCHEARLVIEVDGEGHNRGDAPLSDERRDGWFAARGLLVLRIPAMTILNELDTAVAGIMATANEQIGED
ncbi:endonuclease domain-containing protein [Sphingobium sp.]|uniref:endonuclease domain-containing protein n=1 Tax=Sphingobium sp. TaxID=1912891 RepID=UPI003BB517FF